MKLSYTHCAMYQFYIESMDEYRKLNGFLPPHEILSIYDKGTENCFPRYVHLDQVNGNIIRVSSASPWDDYTIARIGDISEIIAGHFSNNEPIPEQISTTNKNTMYYFHCAVTQNITDENGKESIKEIIKYSVRLGKSKTSMRDILIREMPQDLDSDDVDIHISEVF